MTDRLRGRRNCQDPARPDVRPAAGSLRSACGSQRTARFRPLVVGEAPSRTSDPARPITGTCGRRLAALAGLSFSAFLRAFDRANILTAWPGSTSAKGARFPLDLARSRAARLRRRFRRRTVILLGQRVARAFECAPDYFVEQGVRGGRGPIVVVPHPSGINRWYNDAANVRKMRAFMRATARGTR